MYTQLSDDLLDLRAVTRGSEVPYAFAEEPGCSSGICSTIVICSFLCHICW
jgi:hypothetical protein